MVEGFGIWWEVSLSVCPVTDHQQNGRAAVALGVNFGLWTMFPNLLRGCVTVAILWGTWVLECLWGSALCDRHSGHSTSQQIARFVDERASRLAETG